MPPSRQSGRQPGRQPGRKTIADRLFDAPHRFDPLQAMRVLELGHADDAFQLETVQSLSFLAAPLAGAQAGQSGQLPVGPSRLRIGFIGLTGPLGVLPQLYDEVVVRANRLRNRALAAFLDLFNQRLATLFLRASEKYRVAPARQRALAAGRTKTMDRPADPGPEQADAGTGAGVDPGRDAIAGALRALAGYGTRGLSGRDTLRDDTILYFSGLFARQARSAGALEAMLCDYLDMPAQVEQFVGRWVPVPAHEQSRLGEGVGEGGGEGGGGLGVAFATLGRDAMLGSRVWDAQGSFRIVIGPVRLAQMQALMPEGPALRRLVDLVRGYVGPDLVFDVQVILAAEDVPDLRLGGDADQPPSRLGWDSWVKSFPLHQDARDIVLDPDLVFAGAAG